MTTCRNVIKGALKKLGALAMGREPTAAQSEDALEVLQSLYRELAGQGVFGRLQDVLVTTATYTAREQERVVCDSLSGQTITLPETITQDLLDSAPYDTCGPGYSDYGWGHPVYDVLPRPPRDGAMIVVADIRSDFEKTYLYDANRAYWVLIDGMTLDTEAPLTGRFDNGIKAKLALRLWTHYSKDPASEQIQSEVNTFHYLISMKGDRQSRPVQAEYF